MNEILQTLLSNRPFVYFVLAVAGILFATLFGGAVYFALSNRDKLAAFFSSMLSDESGATSFSRSAAALSLLAVLAWDSYLVITTKKIPDLTQQWVFVGGIYGIGKINETIQKFAKGNGGQKQQ